MTQHLILSLALFGAEPADECGCGEPQSEEQGASEVGRAETPTAGIPMYCDCPKFTYSYYSTDNYWVIGRHPQNSGGGIECGIEQELLVYAANLQVGNCDETCSEESNCRPTDSWTCTSCASAPSGKGEKVAEEGAEDDDQPVCPPLPSLRLPNKKPKAGNPFDFDFPQSSNPHVHSSAGAAVPTWVKVLNKKDGSLFTWVKVFDVPLDRPGRPLANRRHRLGYETEGGPAGPNYEVVRRDVVVPAKVDLGACKDQPVDGLYRLTLSGGEKYFVRMHSRPEDLEPEEDE